MDDIVPGTWGPRAAATTGEQRKAALYITGMVARSAADAAQLLDILGLLPTGIREHGMPGYRAGCRCKTCRRANANRTQRQRAAIRETTTADAPINTTRRSAS